MKRLTCVTGCGHSELVDLSVESLVCQTCQQQSGMDKLIRRYAQSAEHIYDARTAGDYTWLGIFSEFARKVQEQQIVDGEG